MSRRRLFQRRRARIRAAGRWTADEIVAAINAWAFMKGAPPTYDDWSTPDPGFGEHPSSRQVEGVFGAWNPALGAAGYTPRPRHRPTADMATRLRTRHATEGALYRRLAT